jgi:CRP-like cAMP-binding protein
MDLLEILKSVELFEGLSKKELEKVKEICYRRQFEENELIAAQNSPGEELFIIEDGFVEVSVERAGGRPGKVVVNLGNGQTVGEMSLIDQGRRSATVRAVNSPTVVQIIHQTDFEELCDSDTRIGYIVMRNMASDLSFRLRQRNLNDMIRG